MATAADMINRCFRHQHPEVFEPVSFIDPPALPLELLEAPAEELRSDAERIPEEAMGCPGARPL